MIPLPSMIDMYDRLVCLRSEHVGLIHRETIGRCRASLEGLALTSQGQQFVEKDADIFEARVRDLLWRTYRGDKVLGEHLVVDFGSRQISQKKYLDGPTLGRI